MFGNADDSLILGSVFAGSSSSITTSSFFTSDSSSNMDRTRCLCGGACTTGLRPWYRSLTGVSYTDDPRVSVRSGLTVSWVFWRTNSCLNWSASESEYVSDLSSVWRVESDPEDETDRSELLSESWSSCCCHENRSSCDEYDAVSALSCATDTLSEVLSKEVSLASRESKSVSFVASASSSNSPMNSSLYSGSLPGSDSVSSPFAKSSIDREISSTQFTGAATACSCSCSCWCSLLLRFSSAKPGCSSANLRSFN
ncbi:hypothetical protein OGAPHI_001155 [Ogataea philodendri]|uniref:Uncharacterized protein n=1 Tax=Ogataea philodendri TaxID=1378263 RepID=A0A9P8T9T6_9ASCO|nr:uncharacterized protein OGAPHI_001155 [Ogataea philodendri]KAH3670640.1 hypothetical protein OGAPHI_001155 [Ogataea philodendri]